MTEVKKILPAAANEGAEFSSHGSPTAVPKRDREENRKVREVAEELNRVMQSFNTKISFTVDRSLKKTIISVVDAETNKVIRQIPSEEALKIAKNVQSMIGILYDTSA